MYLVDASLRCDFAERPSGPCVYCYNTPARGALLVTEMVDLEAIETTLRREYGKRPGTIVLHGGEPLSWGREVVERLLGVSCELSGKSSLQTNGALIDQEWIGVFKRCKTTVGLSLDGYWPANRWRGHDEATTDLVVANIRRLVDAGLRPGLIIVLHQDNVGESLHCVEELMLDMAKMGVTGKVNPIIHPNPRVELTPEALKTAYLRLADLVHNNGLRDWGPFSLIAGNLLGRPLADCVFTNCDPYHTEAARLITSSGALSFCKKFRTEVLVQDPELLPSMRWDILKVRDCAGCHYAGKVCFGGCPAAAVDWDWRNKTRWCEAFKALFVLTENRLRALMPQAQLRCCSPRAPEAGAPRPGHRDVPHRDHSEHRDTGRPR